MATLAPGEPARMYALGGVARGGATRGGYVSGQVFVKVGDMYPRVLFDSLTITDELDETPNRATFRTDRVVPTTGAPVRITLGSKNSGSPLFAGYVLDVNQIYAADNPDNVQAQVSCTDYTWVLGFVHVTTRYRNSSASTIANDLVARYAAPMGFTGWSVAQGLPGLDEITFTDTTLDECFTRLARRIGAYWYVDYQKDIHLFFSEVRNGDPVELTPAHRTLARFTSEKDRSQCLTRVYVEGRGSTVLTDVQAGDTLLPMEDVSGFVAGGDTFLKAAFQSSEGGAQHIRFTGVVPGRGGTLVGPGIGPGSPLTLTSVAGGVIESGVHDYAVRFQTASGESLASPLTRTTLGPIANPTTAPTNLYTAPTGSYSYSVNMIAGDVVSFCYAYETDGGGTLPGPDSGPITLVSNNDPYNPTYVAPVSMHIQHIGDARVKWIVLYMAAASHAADGYRILIRFPHHAGYIGPEQVSTLGSTYGITPVRSTNTTGQNRIDISTIPIGGVGVTGRRLYRSAANAGQLKLLTTIADNATTTYSDNTPDAALGANMGPGDTSGLVQPSGQVVAGSVEIPIAGTFAFEATGGWAIIGNGDQIIRYTGISGGTKLTGIPASGPGAIVASIAYNSTITAAAMLTGIPASGAGAIVEGLVTGGELYVVVQADDTAAQAALAALVGYGIREAWVQDRRLSVPEARARARATLASRPLELHRVTYDCRDLRTAAGKAIQMNLGHPTNVAAWLKIQAVRIHNFRSHVYPTQYPTFSVEASSARFSFEDWLRIMRTRE